MKKYLFLASVAALSFTACTNETEEFTGTGSASQQKEIALFPLANSSTRAGSGAQSGTLDHSYDMYVAAYKSTPNAGDYFGETQFTYNSDADKWSGARYWPLGVSTLNFLAVTSGPTGTTRAWGTGEPAANFANKVVVTMADNSTAQNDMMWAVGQGSVSESAGTWTFPAVSMQFNHTLAWIKFTEKVTATASGKIKLKSITLNDAKYAGTLTVTWADYNVTTTPGDPTHTWVASGSDLDIEVPGWEGAASALTNEEAAAVGNGLMIVPQAAAGFASFTVAYQIQNPATLAWEDYTYTHTPTVPTDRIVSQGYQYTYNITFNLNEIMIAPTVSTWANGGSQGITIL